MLELLLALNFQAPDCPDYWVKPNTHQVECLYQDGGRLVNMQPPSGSELFLREEGSNYYLDRSSFVRRGAIVGFPLIQKLPRSINGTDQISYWYRVNCKTGKSAIDYVNMGQGWVKNPTNRLRTQTNGDAQRLVREVCR